MITRQDVLNHQLLNLYDMSGISVIDVISFKIPDGDEPCDAKKEIPDDIQAYLGLMYELVFARKLKPADAIAEMNGLSVNNALRLKREYCQGLRGEQLRKNQTPPLRQHSMFANTPKYPEKPVSDEDTLWLAIKDQLDSKASRDELEAKNAVCELIANSTNPIGYYAKTEYAFLRHTNGYPRKFIPLRMEMSFDCREESAKLNAFCDKFIKLKERRDAKYVEVMQGLPAEKPVSDDDAMWQIIKSNIYYQDADHDGKNGYWGGGAETEQNVANAMMRKMATSNNPIGYLKKANEYIKSRHGEAEFARRNMQVDYWLGNLGGLADRRKELQMQLEQAAQAAADSVRRHGF